MASRIEPATSQQLTRKQKRERSGPPDLVDESRFGSVASGCGGDRHRRAAAGLDRDAEPVRTFGCFTADLLRMAAWFKEFSIKTVGMLL